MIVKTKVKTGCKTQYIKILDDVIEIGVESLPEKGKANLEVIKMLSTHYNVPTSNIKLIKGAKNKEKVFSISI
ncbi:MAG: DUF167 domain-containing protein [Candidatus Aenigmarchaeota archaeon]|nr:DUF167 domain-containing protein [Candidatus Aenigmarchaeota archaeon]